MVLKMSFVNYSAIYPHPGLHGKFPELVYQGPWRRRIWEDARAKCEHIFIYFGWCVFMRTLMILAPWSMSYYLVLELLLLLEWEELCWCYPKEYDTHSMPIHGDYYLHTTATFTVRKILSSMLVRRRKAFTLSAATLKRKKMEDSPWPHPSKTLQLLGHRVKVVEVYLQLQETRSQFLPN